MKKKNTIIGVSVLAAGLIAIGTMLLITGKISKTAPKTDTNDSKEYNSLFDIANEMYEDNSYLKLPKNNNGSYYMTIGEYKNSGYNLTLIDSTCPDDFGIIYFDIENKDKYMQNPIYIVESCQEEASPVSSLLSIANEIYENNDYLDLPKDEYGSYYMTIGEYKNRGYNIDLLDSTCSDDSQLIYFDIENKDKYEYYPVYILEQCHK